MQKEKKRVTSIDEGNIYMKRKRKKQQKRKMMMMRRRI